MYIFIDEAGGFQIPSVPHQVSCTAALVVPESFSLTLFRRFRKLIRPWKAPGLELKGSQLSESQMAQVISTVRRFDVLLVATAIDMGIHSEQGISNHKKEQAEKVLVNVSAQTPKSRRAQLESLSSRVLTLSNQLYVQSVLLKTLVDSVLTASTLYYSQRIPKTLGKFCWRIDAKDRTLTNYEKLWQEIVAPLLQTLSLSNPLGQMRGADYSAFQRFTGERPEPPPHLRERIIGSEEPFRYVDIDLLLSDLKFRASHQTTGIQIVDMLAAAIRRACNNTLQPKGWNGLGRLMPQPIQGKNAVRLLALEDIEPVRLPYANVVKRWDRETRRMII